MKYAKAGYDLSYDDCMKLPGTQLDPDQAIQTTGHIILRGGNCCFRWIFALFNLQRTFIGI